MAVKDMQTAELVDTVVWLEKERKQNIQKTNAYKAELQARGLAAIEDKNIRFIRFQGGSGSCSVADTQSLDILNPIGLREAMPEGLFDSLVSVEIKPAYKPPAKLEKALKAIFIEEYTREYTLAEFLSFMSVSPDEKQRKMLLKKLKGEYEKDKSLLESLFSAAETDWDVELWYINRIKNMELIKTYFGEDVTDEALAAMRRCILVESKTALRIEAEDADAES